MQATKEEVRKETEETFLGNGFQVAIDLVAEKIYETSFQLEQCEARTTSMEGEIAHIETLKMENVNLKQRIANYQAGDLKLRSDLEKRNNEYSSLLQSYANLQSERNTLSASNNDLKDELALVNKHFTELQTSFNRLTEEKTYFCNIIKIVSERLHESIDLASNSMERYEGKLIEPKQRFEHWDARSKKYESRIKRLDELVDELAIPPDEINDFPEYEKEINSLVDQFTAFNAVIDTYGKLKYKADLEAELQQDRLLSFQDDYVIWQNLSKKLQEQLSQLEELQVACNQSETNIEAILEEHTSGDLGNNFIDLKKQFNLDDNETTLNEISVNDQQNSSVSFDKDVSDIVNTKINEGDSKDNAQSIGIEVNDLTPESNEESFESVLMYPTVGGLEEESEDN